MRAIPVPHNYEETLPFTVRKAEKTDLWAILSLKRLALQAEGTPSCQALVTRIIPRYRSYMRADNCHVWVAEDSRGDGSPFKPYRRHPPLVGFAVACSNPLAASSQCIWLLPALYTHPGQKRQGVAKALLQTVTDKWGHEGVLGWALHENIALCGLYEGSGATVYPAHVPSSIHPDIPDDAPQGHRWYSWLPEAA